MVSFLASSIGYTAEVRCNPANSFEENLMKYLPQRELKGLFIASNPANFAGNDKGSLMRKSALEGSGLTFSEFEILDNRNKEFAKELVSNAEFIFLSGGHVPTQNKFFKDINLKEIIKNFNGVLLGMSAGAMNSAENVYVCPELEGEAASLDFRRFEEGAGLTKTNIVPHYHSWKKHILDGMRLMEDIVYPDSMGRKFYLLPDGSYLLCVDGEEKIYGEAFLAQDGKMKKVNENNSVLKLK